jgi:hypothetical protein
MNKTIWRVVASTRPGIERIVQSSCYRNGMPPKQVMLRCAVYLRDSV